MSLGIKVSKLREKLGLNQKQLADAAGISQATLSRIESGQIQELKSEALKGLALALGVTVDFLIGKTNKMTSNEAIQADPTAQYLFRGYENLSGEGKKQLVDFVKFLENQEKGKRKGDK